MSRHLAIVAYTFKTVGVICGIPSFPALVCLLWIAIRMHFATTTPSSNTTASSNPLVDMIASGLRSADQLFHFLATAAEWLIWVLAIVALLLVVLAVALFFTGQGLQAHQLWARVLAILLTCGLLLVSSGGVLSFQRGTATLIGSALMLASLYSLWALLRRF
jgi:hypothetical protein